MKKVIILNLLCIFCNLSALDAITFKADNDMKVILKKNDIDIVRAAIVLMNFRVSGISATESTICPCCKVNFETMRARCGHQRHCKKNK